MMAPMDLLGKPKQEAYDTGMRLLRTVGLAEKAMNKQSRTSSKDAQMKVRLHLQQKGYPKEIINQVFDGLDSEKSEEDELFALRIQGDKVWRRYSRKAEGRELEQKVKGNLYQKGFPGDLINQYIEEKKQEMDVE